MIDWVARLQEALSGEFGHKPQIAALATVDHDHRPRVRSMVIRRVEADGTLWFCSDRRGEKADHLAASAYAEVVFWLPELREQFRVAGVVKEVGEQDRRNLWVELSDSARALFAWPASGLPVIDPAEPLPRQLPAETPIPEPFGAWSLRPDRVEHLTLKGHPHRRTRWDGPPTWKALEINP